MKLEGSGAIICGGGSGLGLVTAERLRSSGAEVGVIDMRRGGWDGPLAEADIADEAAVERAFAELESAVGPLRVFLNTASRQPGVGGGTSHVGLTAGPGRSVMPEAFRRAIEVNILGAFVLTQCAAERMMAGDPDANGERGVILHTSSIVAMEGQIGTAAYAASKGGVDAMILPLAREFAPYGVRVMSIAPGIFETPMFSNATGPMVEWLREQVQFPARPGEPDEFAHAVQAVVENPMFNGTVLRLDGAFRVPPGRREWWTT